MEQLEDKAAEVVVAVVATVAVVVAVVAVSGLGKRRLGFGFHCGPIWQFRLPI